MFLVHYAVLAACMALPQISTYFSSSVSPAAPSASAQQPAPQSPQSNLPVGGTAIVPQQIHKVDPPSPNATVQQLEDAGDDLRAEKAFADALDYYRAAMAKTDSAVLHNKAGITYLEMLRYDVARHEFERATKMNKRYAEPYNNLGVIEYIHKRYGRAAKRYEEAIKLEDDSASFHSNLGTAYFAQKEYEKASVEYSRALALDPDIFEHRSRSGVSLQLASAEDRARYEYVIAKMYATTGNADRCLLYLRKAIEDGYDKIDDVYKDREFTNLRKDPRFTALMAARSKVLQIPPDQAAAP
ncbi:MAG TPA: tetratricopeptide repeat protein [Terriglobales bacterium]|jgi:tetratricopeptide (TPR) repeat protein|nr:tetratricopeptide repeat protein [Terriglobales bacterium]